MQVVVMCTGSGCTVVKQDVVCQNCLTTVQQHNKLVTRLHLLPSLCRCSVQLHGVSFLLLAFHDCCITCETLQVHTLAETCSLASCVLHLVAGERDVLMGRAQAWSCKLLQWWYALVPLQ